MLAIVFAGRNTATRLLPRIRATRFAIVSVFDIGTMRSVTRAFLGPVPVTRHTVPREMSSC